MLFVKRIIPILLLLCVGVWGFNSPLMRAEYPPAKKSLLSYHGVHQIASVADQKTGKQQCTAPMISVPNHMMLENTLPSMKAAFEAGADVLKLDVHLTIDEKWAIFRDAKLDCRSNGQGFVRDATMKYLKTLDIGYGYSADGGKSFPLRGRYIGAMPELEEVLAAFPAQTFLINFQSKDPKEGQAFAALLESNPDYKSQIWAVSGEVEPLSALSALHSDIRHFSAQSVEACLLAYKRFGWIGSVPQACHNQLLSISLDDVSWLWGWPGVFHHRMQEAGAALILHNGSLGFDDAASLETVPTDIGGHLVTHKIEAIGPAFRK